MQALDMFLRFPEYANKFISVCGVPLPLMSRLVNLAQCNLIQEAIDHFADEQNLRLRMGFARFFFRLSCATEEALQILTQKTLCGKSKSGSQFKKLEDYFLEDSINYRNEFSPYSFNLYKRMVSNFDLPTPTLLLKEIEKHPELILVDINSDSYVRSEDVDKTFTVFKDKKINVIQKTFNSNFGHEAWILDGVAFYEFIKNDFFN